MEWIQDGGPKMLYMLKIKHSEANGVIIQMEDSS